MICFSKQNLFIFSKETKKYEFFLSVRPQRFFKNQKLLLFFCFFWDFTCFSSTFWKKVVTKCSMAIHFVVFNFCLLWSKISSKLGRKELPFVSGNILREKWKLKKTKTKWKLKKTKKKKKIEKKWKLKKYEKNEN